MSKFQSRPFGLKIYSQRRLPPYDYENAWVIEWADRNGCHQVRFTGPSAQRLALKYYSPMLKLVQKKD